MIRLLASDSVPRSFPPPDMTRWRPIGERTTAVVSETHGWQTTYARTIHTDTHSSDETPLAIAPMFKPAWTVETNMFIAEGPVFDSHGNIYFSPIFPPENVLLVSLEPETGKRRWAYNGQSAGAGTPFIYSDPQKGQDVIYFATYDRVIALTTAGEVIYDRPSGLLAPAMTELNAAHHNYGSNYHLQADAIISVMGDGHVLVVDRQTGASLLPEPYQLPGDKTAVTNISLPESLKKSANQDFSKMYGGVGEEYEEADPISGVFHALYGELQQVTNFFSIDKNTGRIWIAASLPDAEDGVEDGWSDMGALYGLELSEKNDAWSLDVKTVVKFNGGTSSTPTISADGRRVYVADAFNHLFAIDASTGDKIWSLEVPDLITGSLAVSADNGEIFANIRNDIIKIYDRGDHGELDWIAEMTGYQPGRFQRNFKGLGAQIGANGIAFTGAVGVVRKNSQKLPFKLGAGVIDRQTGKLRFFVDGAEDSVSSVVIGPDGNIYIGNSPLRRILARAMYGQTHSPHEPKGGVTKFETVRHDLLLRDALFAAGARAENTARVNDVGSNAMQQDIWHIDILLSQARRAGVLAVEEGVMTNSEWSVLEGKLQAIQASLGANTEILSQQAASMLTMAESLNASNHD